MTEVAVMEAVAETPNVGLKSDSNLEKVLRAGHFAVTGELGPPKSADADVIRKKVGLPQRR